MSAPEPSRDADDGVARPLILGIETSCDDTACALVDGRGRVLSSMVSSQFAAHRPYGGVVPEIASREHLANWPAVSEEALDRAGRTFDQVDAVAATRGPGLVGSLLVGLSLGKALAFALDRPFHGIHHLEGHLYSPFLAATSEASGGTGEAEEPPARFVGLVVSGGHTSLFQVEDGTITTLAETRDDAMGEAFDKVGKKLGLPYPQGPEVDRLAELGDASRFRLPVATCGDTLDFSYSGLKTQTAVQMEAELERLRAAGTVFSAAVSSAAAAYAPEQERPFPEPILDLLAAFRHAAVEQILARLVALHKKAPIPLLAVSGGAAANRLLRRRLEAWAHQEGIPLRLVPLGYSGDNAAMIAHAALYAARGGEAGGPGDSFTVEAASRIPL